MATEIVERQDAGSLDAFISYRRIRGRWIAGWLRDRLQSYRLPPELAETLGSAASGATTPPRVYLDTAYERAGPDFWDRKIKPNLEQARYLIVVSTPDAFEPRSDGEPNWLVREIEYFLSRAGPERIILVLGPDAPEDRFPGPLSSSTHWDWVDLRRYGRLRRLWPGLWNALDDAVTKVAAQLYQVPDALLPKLYQEDERKRARRLRRTATVSVIAAALMAGLALFALIQRQDARAQARNALAREDAAQATALRLQQPYALPLAALLAVRSAQQVPTLLAYQELQQTLDLLPELEAVLPSETYQPNVAYDRTSRRLVLGGSRGLSYVLEAWEPDSLRLVHRENLPAKAVPALSPGGAFVALGVDELGGPHEIRFLRWGAWSRPTVTHAATYTKAPQFAPGGRAVVVANGPDVVVYDPETGDTLAWHRFSAASGRYTTGTTGVMSDAEVDTVVISHDSRRIAVGVGDRLVVLEDWQSMHPSVRIDHSEPEMATKLMAFDPSGRWLAAARGSFPKTLLLFDLDAAGAAPLRRSSSSTITALEFSPDSRRLAIAYFEGEAELLDVPTLASRGQRMRHEGMLRQIDGIAFSPGGTLVATQSADQTARIWEAATANEVARLTHRGDHVDHVSFVDEERLLTVGRDGTVKIWRLPHDVRLPFPADEQNFRLFASTTDGRCLAAASNFLRSRLAVVCGPHWTLQWTHAFRENMTALAVDRRDGALLAIAANQLWRWPQWQDSMTTPERKDLGRGRFPSFSADGHLLAVETPARTVKLVDTATGDSIAIQSPITTDAARGHSLSGLVLSADGSTLAVTTVTTTNVYELPSGRVLLSDVVTDVRQDVALDAMGRYLAVTTARRPERTSANPVPLIQLWDVRTRQRVDSLAGGFWGYNGIAFAPDASLLAAGSSDRIVRMLSIPELEEVGRIVVGSEVGRVAFTADGSRLLIGADGVQRRRITLADLVTETCRRLGVRDRTLLESHVPEAAPAPQAAALDPVAICGR